MEAKKFNKLEIELTRYFSYTYGELSIEMDKRIVKSIMELWNTMDDQHKNVTIVRVR